MRVQQQRNVIDQSQGFETAIAIVQTAVPRRQEFSLHTVDQCRQVLALTLS